MDDHFNQILSSAREIASSRSQQFIPSQKFTGSKRGYYFTKGDQGLGYYEDLKQLQLQLIDSSADGGHQQEDARKRKRTDDSEVRLDSYLDEKGIEKLLEDAESSGIVPLDAISLKQQLINFEKKIAKNQNMRMKYTDQPEKFMESELELHAAINDLYVVAASPELYSVVVDAGSVNNILGMITHENTDISLAAVGLLQEMLDAEVIAEADEAMTFVNAFLDLQGLELIVQNLSRLDESNEEDAQGVYNTMAVVENLVDIESDIAIKLCEKTHILKFLLMRLKVRKFDANKLYCSEILSILLQADPHNQQRLCHLHGLNGMDMLLQTIAPYRKKDPSSGDEQECIHNLFLSLCAVLLEKEHQDMFSAAEGFELMLRCMKEQKYATVCAVRVLNYATSGNKANCEKLVDIGGLKFIFPILMGRGLPKIAHGSKGSAKHKEVKEAEELAMSMISQLCMQLHDVTDEDCSNRLLAKFVENEREKLERCVELFIEFGRLLEATDQRIARTIQSLEENEDEEALEEFASEENIYLERMQGGLFNLQQMATTIAFVILRDEAALLKADLKLSAEGLSLQDVLAVLHENVQNMADEVDDADDEEAGRQPGGLLSSLKPKKEEGEVKEENKDKKLLQSWVQKLGERMGVEIEEEVAGEED